jgi:hypothetical protein
MPRVSPIAMVAGAVVRIASDGAAPLALACPATEVDGCRGRIYLDPAPKTKSSKKKGRKAKVRARMARRGRFGSSPFKIAAGKKKRVKVRLSASARAKLGLRAPRKARAARRGRRVKAVMTVVQKGKSHRQVIELRG